MIASSRMVYSPMTPPSCASQRAPFNCTSELAVPTWSLTQLPLRTSRWQAVMAVAAAVAAAMVAMASSTPEEAVERTAMTAAAPFTGAEVAEPTTMTAAISPAAAAAATERAALPPTALIAAGSHGQWRRTVIALIRMGFTLTAPIGTAPRRQGVERWSRKVLRPTRVLTVCRLNLQRTRSRSPGPREYGRTSLPHGQG